MCAVFGNIKVVDSFVLTVLLFRLSLQDSPQQKFYANEKDLGKPNVLKPNTSAANSRRLVVVNLKIIACKGLLKFFTCQDNPYNL